MMTVTFTRRVTVVFFCLIGERSAAYEKEYNI